MEKIYLNFTGNSELSRNLIWVSIKFGQFFPSMLPPPLAARFTWGEVAVMRIVGDECRAHGQIPLPIDSIAGRAGRPRTTVQNPVREAQGRGEVPGSPIITV